VGEHGLPHGIGNFGRRDPVGDSGGRNGAKVLFARGHDDGGFMLIRTARAALVALTLGVALPWLRQSETLATLLIGRRRQLNDKGD
jgi:hypothetical protein